jgi:hypothetical protein
MNEEQHAIHMQNVSQGLQAIMQSEDINEIKQIAQALLQEEAAEQQAEQPGEEEAMRQGLEQEVKSGGFNG